MTISPHLLAIPEEDFEVQTSETKGKNDSQKTQTVELGAVDLFKHAGCRNVTLIMFVAWTATTLG